MAETWEQFQEIWSSQQREMPHRVKGQNKPEVTPAAPFQRRGGQENIVVAWFVDLETLYTDYSRRLTMKGKKEKGG